MVLLFKKILYGFVALCCVLIGWPLTAQASVPASVSASGAVLFEPQSGRVLFEQQAHVKRPMASTTKLMTALVAAERLPLGRRVTVSDEALQVIGSSMGLQVGDKLTVEDLLKGLLLASGNDAANVLALATAPSLEAFAACMNARAQALGMRNTHFVTPSGLDADEHGSTPYDMALLAAAVLQHPTLSAICAMRQARVHIGDRAVTLTNHNKLLAMYDGAIGMKTGFTKLAGRCLVSAARRDGVTLIAVTLNCADDWQTHKALLDAGFAQMRCVPMPKPLLSHLPVFGGRVSAVPLTVAPSTTVVLSGQEASIESVVHLPPYLWAPVKSGDTVGWVTYRLGGDEVARAPITVADTVEEATVLSSWDRFLRTFSALVKQALTE